MFHTIVVGCDGSEHQPGAVALAEGLLDPDRGRLILTNAYRPATGFGAAAVQPFAYADWLAHQGREILDRAARQVAGRVPVERQLISGVSAAAGLDTIAGTFNADLIVLGASHRGLAGELAARKTVQRLLHGAPCALAVAGTEEAAVPPSAPRILVAFDASAEARYALDLAYEMATSLGGSVVVCTVLETIVYAAGYAGGMDIGLDEQRKHDANAALAAAAAEAPEGVTVTRHLLWGDTFGAVRNLADHEADLIIAGSRGYGALRRVLAGSVSGPLLCGARVPTLVTPRTLVAAAREAIASC